MATPYLAEALILYRLEDWAELTNFGCREFRQWNRQERGLLSEAFQMLMKKQRRAWIAQSKVRLHKARSGAVGKEFAVEVCDDFLAQTRAEVTEVCKTFITLVERAGLTGPEVNAWAEKMKGDAYRYMALVGEPTKDESKRAYEQARQLSQELTTSSTINSTELLGLRASILCNFGCYFAQLEDDKAKAREMVDQAARLSPQNNYFDQPLAIAVAEHNKQVWA